MRAKSWVVLVLVLGISSSAGAVTWQQDPQVDSETAAHFVLSAAGTFLFSQLYQYYGMDRDAANVITPIQVLGVGLAKAFYTDPSAKPYSVAADALGVLVGTVANITVKFDYPRQKGSPSSSTRAPSPGSRLRFSYRDAQPFTHG